jgi:hypothetical protein
MPETKPTDHWYAVYLVRAGEATHAGHLHVQSHRDGDARVLEQNITIEGEVNHRARCVLTLKRSGGRLLPLDLKYKDSHTSTHLEFHEGRLRASGGGRENHGDSCPSDVMPTYGVASLAKSIFNQPDASVTFTPMTDSNGDLGAHGSRLVARGLTDHSPFPIVAKCWQVDWLSPEGSVVQSFYFNDEGVVVQANWGGSLGVLAVSEQAAKSPRRSTARIDDKRPRR